LGGAPAAYSAAHASPTARTKVSRGRTRATLEQGVAEAAVLRAPEALRAEGADDEGSVAEPLGEVGRQGIRGVVDRGDVIQDVRREGAWDLEGGGAEDELRDAGEDRGDRAGPGEYAGREAVGAEHLLDVGPVPRIGPGRAAVGDQLGPRGASDHLVAELERRGERRDARLAPLVERRREQGVGDPEGAGDDRGGDVVDVAEDQVGGDLAVGAGERAAEIVLVATIDAGGGVGQARGRGHPRPGRLGARRVDLGEVDAGGEAVALGEAAPVGGEQVEDLMAARRERARELEGRQQVPGLAEHLDEDAAHAGSSGAIQGPIGATTRAASRAAPATAR
jgi:hypothetical protein